MFWHELADTLLSYIESVEPHADAAIQVTRASFQFPLEVSGGLKDGKLVMLANPPHTRWKSGVLPPLHQAAMSVSFDEGEEADA